MTHSYFYSGLRVASQLALPEWSDFEQPVPFEPPDVHIRTDDRASAGDLSFIGPDEYRFHVPEVGWYWVRAGQEIVVAPESAAGLREVRLFLLGTAWAALCYQRGLLPLHASVVWVGEHAVAFCGTTGAGKSTLVAWLCARGYRFISDDLCRFEMSRQGQALVYPSALRVKLWRDALERLGWSHEGLERDHFQTDKFHLPLSPPIPSFPFSAGNQGNKENDALPLRAIYLLGWGALSISRLSGMTALRRLVAAATYRGELLEPMGRIADHWQRCAELLRSVSVWEFARPRDWAGTDAAMQMLMAYVESYDRTEMRQSS